MKYLYVEFQPGNEKSAPVLRKRLQISLWGIIAAAVIFTVTLAARVISLLIRLRRDGVRQIYTDMRRR